MTANNPSPSDLSVTRTTSLLERLSSTVAHHAAAEEALTREARTRRLTLERRQQEATAALDQQLAREAGIIDNAWLERWEHTRGHHEQRMLRIEKAERNSQRDMPRRIEAARAHWLGGLQRQRLAQERALTSQAGQTLEQYKARQGRLAEAQAGLAKLRRRAHQAFNGSPGFRLFLKAPGTASPETDANEALAAVERQLPLLTEQLTAYRQKPLPRFFSVLTPALLAVVILAAAFIMAYSPLML